LLPELAEVASHVEFGPHRFVGVVVVDSVALNRNGPDLVSPCPTTDLRTPFGVALFDVFGGACNLQSSSKEPPCGLTVDSLAPATIDPNHDARRRVGEEDTGIGLIPMLPPWPRATGEGFLQITFVQMDFVSLWFLEDRNRYRAGVDAPSLFVGGYTLKAMTACFVAKGDVCVFAGDAHQQKAGTLLDQFVVKGAPKNSTGCRCDTVPGPDFWRLRRLLRHEFLRECS